MDNNIIDGQMLMKMVLAGANKLNAEKASIDSLNVFPVPDGDTGTNMSLTLNSAGKFLRKIDQEKITVSEVASQMAYGALMGARGNSGVILSQILGGIASALIEKDQLDSESLVAGFASGVEAAYKAVVKPMEGTILTVAREASGYLTEQYHPEISVAQCFQLYLEEGYRSLARTPDILPVLKQANVVDAGAKGLLVIVEGMLAGLLGQDDFVFEASEPMEAHGMMEHFNINPDEIIFQYCTEVIVKNKANLEVDKQVISDFLEEIGDSILVVATPEVTKIHVHTNFPGQVLEHCVTFGDLNDVKIENMKAQSQAFEGSRVEKDLAIIAVSSGEGLNKIFTSLGVDVIITGGQTMNPSTEEFLDAIDKVYAKEVILLPNNKNIILTADQAAKLSEKIMVHVIPTKTIPQGIAALMAFNEEVASEENVVKMTESIGHITTGEITYAVRDTSLGEQEIKEGQILGIVDGKIAVVGDDVTALITDTLLAMNIAQYELVTLYYGVDVGEQEARDLLDTLEKHYPDIDFELHYGAQAVYFYLISAE